MSDMMWLLLITFGLSWTGHAVQTSTSLFNTGTLILGEKMEGYTLRTVLKVSVTQCVEECERRSDCGSFNYVRRFHMCELKPVSVTTANRVLTDAIGYVFGNKQSMYSAVCGVGNCGPGQVCDAASAICRAEECSPMTPSVNAYKMGNMNAVGSKVVLGCNEGFNNHVCPHYKLTSDCRVEGTTAYWSIPTMTCHEGISFQIGDLCYFIDFNNKTWENAKAMCTRLGGYLAEIDVMNTLQPYRGNLTGLGYIWIGGTDKEVEGQWQWAHSGKQIANLNWNQDEPNGGRGENCMFTDDSLKTYDAPCSWPTRYMCEAVVQ